MNNEREILLHSIAGIINMQPTNDIFLRIMTSRDVTVVKSLAKFIYGCFKQIKGVVNCQNSRDKGPPEDKNARG